MASKAEKLLFIKMEDPIFGECSICEDLIRQNNYFQSSCWEFVCKVCFKEMEVMIKEEKYKHICRFSDLKAEQCIYIEIYQENKELICYECQKKVGENDFVQEKKPCCQNCVKVYPRNSFKDFMSSLKQIYNTFNNQLKFINSQREIINKYIRHATFPRTYLEVWGTYQKEISLFEQRFEPIVPIESCKTENDLKLLLSKYRFAKQLEEKVSIPILPSKLIPLYGFLGLIKPDSGTHNFKFLIRIMFEIDFININDKILNFGGANNVRNIQEYISEATKRNDLASLRKLGAFWAEEIMNIGFKHKNLGVLKLVNREYIDNPKKLDKIMKELGISNTNER